MQRLQSLGGVLNPTAADSGSAERKRLMATIRLLQPDHDERMRSIEVVCETSSARCASIMHIKFRKHLP